MDWKLLLWFRSSQWLWEIEHSTSFRQHVFYITKHGKRCNYNRKVATNNIDSNNIKSSYDIYTKTEGILTDEQQIFFASIFVKESNRNKYEKLKQNTVKTALKWEFLAVSLASIILFCVFYVCHKSDIVKLLINALKSGLISILLTLNIIFIYASNFIDVQSFSLNDI